MLKKLFLFIAVFSTIQLNCGIDMNAEALIKSNLVQDVLRGKCDVNNSDYNGNTALMSAVYMGIETVKILLGKGANINAQNSKGYTALMYASAEGFKNIVQVLLENEADSNLEDHYGNKALTYAMVNLTHNKQIIDMLLSRETNVNFKNKAGDNILYALDKFSLEKEMLQELLAKGIDINAQNNKGETPLINASYNNDIYTLNLLLEQGADFTIEDKTGRNPFFYAALAGNKDIMQILLNYGFDINSLNSMGENALIHICRQRRDIRHEFELETVKWLVSKKIDVNVSGHSGITALMMAAFYDNDDFVKFLLTAGAELNLETSQGNALIFAIKCRSLRTFKLLLKSGANVNAKDKEGWTALMHAASTLNERWNDKRYFATRAEVEKMILDLLKYGAEVKNESGGMTLLQVISKLSFEIVKKLVELGANVNYRNKDGDSPLLEALRPKYCEDEIPHLVNLLLEKNAEVNIANSSGETPLIRAIELSQISSAISTTSALSLIAKGADINIKNRRGETALDVAKRNENIDLVRALLKYQNM